MRFGAATCGLLALGWCAVAAAQAPYVDVAVVAGLPPFMGGELHGIGGNVAVFDADGDGRLDVGFADGQGAGVRLFRNTGGPGAPAFAEVTVEAGLAGLAGGGATVIGLGAGDLDRDGDVDLYLACVGVDHLLLNDGHGVFADESAVTLDGRWGFQSAVALGDVDGDGDLEVFVGGYLDTVAWPFHTGGRDRLLVRDGAGRYIDRAAARGVDSDRPALSAAFTDLDDDGDLDLLVARDFGPLVGPSGAFRNEGPGAPFVDVAGAWGLGRRVYGMGVAVLDLDGDGAVDVYLSSIGRAVALVGPPVGAPGGPLGGPPGAPPAGMQERTDALGLGAPRTAAGWRVGWAPEVVDVDGDGVEDLWVRTGKMASTWFLANEQEQADVVWRLDGHGGAERMDPGLSAPMPSAGRGLVSADVDGDGRVDLVAGSAEDGPVHLWMGQGAPSSVHVVLHPTVSAPGAAGARLVLGCPGGDRVREVPAGGAFASVRPPGEVWLGVPAGCEGAPLRVRWPSGVSTDGGLASRGGRIDAEEPAWVQVLPGAGDVAVRVQPQGEGGPLGPGHAVAVEAGGAIAVAVHAGDGWYEAVLARPVTGELHATLWLDGAPLRPHPAVTAAPSPGPEVRVHPAHLVARRAATVTVLGPPGATLGMEVDGASLAGGVSEGPGRAWATLQPPAVAGEIVVTPLVDGVPGEPVSLQVHPGASPAESSVVVDSPWPVAGSAVQVRAVVRDVNRWPADDVAMRVTVDGAPVADATGSGALYATSLVVPPGAVVDGASLAVLADGEPLAAPVTLHTWTTTAELLAAADPSRSSVGLAFEGCAAGVGDGVAVVALLRTADGHPLPRGPLAGVLGALGPGGGAATSLASVGTHLEGSVPCGDVEGALSVTLVGDGLSPGIAAPLVVRPPAPGAPDPARTELVVDGPVGGPGAQLYLRVTPRDAWGDLLGPGLAVGVRVRQGEGCFAAPWCGGGHYCASGWVSPDEGGSMVLEAVVGGAPSGSPLVLAVEGAGEAPSVAPDVALCGPPAGEAEPDASGGDAVEGGVDAGGPGGDVAVRGGGADGGAALGEVPDEGEDDAPPEGGPPGQIRQAEPSTDGGCAADGGPGGAPLRALWSWLAALLVWRRRARHDQDVAVRVRKVGRVVPPRAGRSR